MPAYATGASSSSLLLRLLAVSSLAPACARSAHWNNHNNNDAPTLRRLRGVCLPKLSRARALRASKQRPPLFVVFAVLSSTLSRARSDVARSNSQLETPHTQTPSHLSYMRSTLRSRSPTFDLVLRPSISFSDLRSRSRSELLRFALLGGWLRCRASPQLWAWQDVA